ncbi:hypothetical protein DM02DRAFT_659769 [Periconia macrospinosa]|uniref:Uncharacterized protein n=1 Tax=Periconia macrospinosa TaxID=97972 RepID=A0A2V1DCI8_9PLEO|nr:hypothetical protein DM02DRAFT_659769 [Periconia macrospinosa]
MPLSSVFPFTFSMPSFVTNFFWPSNRFEPLPTTPSPPNGTTDTQSANVTRRPANPAAVPRNRAAANLSRATGYQLPPRYGINRTATLRSAPRPSSAPVASVSPDVPAAPVFRSSAPPAYGASRFPPFGSSRTPPLNPWATKPLAAPVFSSSLPVGSLPGPALGSPWNPNTHNTFATSWTSSSSGRNGESPDVEMVDSPPESPTVEMVDSPPESPTVDLSSELHIEADDGTLPEGYIGTCRGIRFTLPDITSEPQCSSQLHLLALKFVRDFMTSAASRSATATTTTTTTNSNNKRPRDRDEESEDVDPMEVDVVERRDPNKRQKTSEGGAFQTTLQFKRTRTG